MIGQIIAKQVEGRFLIDVDEKYDSTVTDSENPRMMKYLIDSYKRSGRSSLIEMPSRPD
jgi:hypothetical protein